MKFPNSHSGVSWALNAGDRDIYYINNWPNPQASIATADQVPSKITYNNGKVDKWGFAMSSTDIPLKWFKVLLDPSHKYSKSDLAKPASSLLARQNKTAQEVSTDYLQRIWEFTLDDIKRKRGEDFKEKHPLKVVLTVPAVWSQAAKEETRRAAQLAGLPDVELVAEPEAAALAVFKSRKANNDLQVRDKTSSTAPDLIC
jgi:Hsp70 protein